MGLGWDDIRRIGRDINRGYNEFEGWLGDWQDEGYSWFGIESKGGTIYISNAPRDPRFASWGDALNPDLRGPLPYLGSGSYQNREGWSYEIGVEFNGAPGVPPAGSRFIGHPGPCAFDALTMTMIGGEPMEEEPNVRAGFSARLVQRDLDGRPIFVSGWETSLSDDGVIYREDLRLPARSSLRALETYGGPIEPFLPLFITLTPFGDFAGVTGTDNLQVQVTANLVFGEVERVGQSNNTYEVSGSRISYEYADDNSGKMRRRRS